MNLLALYHTGKSQQAKGVTASRQRGLQIEGTVLLLTVPQWNENVLRVLVKRLVYGRSQGSSGLEDLPIETETLMHGSSPSIPNKVKKI